MQRCPSCGGALDPETAAFTEDGLVCQICHLRAVRSDEAQMMDSVRAATSLDTKSMDKRRDERSRMRKHPWIGDDVHLMSHGYGGDKLVLTFDREGATFFEIAADAWEDRFVDGLRNMPLLAARATRTRRRTWSSLERARKGEGSIELTFAHGELERLRPDYEHEARFWRALRSYLPEHGERAEPMKLVEAMTAPGCLLALVLLGGGLLYVAVDWIDDLDVPGGRRAKWLSLIYRVVAWMGPTAVAVIAGVLALLVTLWMVRRAAKRPLIHYLERAA